MPGLSKPQLKKLIPALMYQMGTGGVSTKSTLVDFTKSISGAQLVALFPLEDTEGIIAVDEINSPAQDGLYDITALANVKGPDGIILAPTFDGVDDLVNIDTVQLQSQFDDIDFTVSIWAKYVGDWEDPTLDQSIFRFRVDNENLFLFKRNMSNAMQTRFVSGGVGNTILRTTSTEDWFLMTMTVSLANDTFRSFYNGTKSGADRTGLGAWVDGPWVQALLGAATFPPIRHWPGSISTAGVWGKALLPPQILELYNQEYSSYIDRGVGLDPPPNAYWALNEPASATEAVDQIDSPDQDSFGTSVTFGSTLAPDGVNTSAFFSSGDYISIKRTALYASFDPDEFTIMLWYKSDGTGGGNKNLLFFRDDVFNEVVIFKNASQDLILFREANSSQLSVQPVDDINNDTNWHHVAMVVSLSGDYIRPYVDGVLYPEVTGLVAWNGDKVYSEMVIGAENQTPSQSWAGNIAHVEIYPRPLRGEEVAYRYMHTLDQLTEYKDQIKDVDLSNLLLQYNLDEAIGTTVNNYQGNVAGNTIYTGVDLADIFFNDGSNAAYWDGSNDYVAFNLPYIETNLNGAEGSLGLWLRGNTGFFSNGVEKFAAKIRFSGSNQMTIKKESTDVVRAIYQAGGTTNFVDGPVLSDLTWYLCFITWSASKDEFKFYINDAQTGTTQGTLGVWDGATINSETLIGADTNGPSKVWDGWLHKLQLYTRPLSLTEIRYIYNQGVA